MSGGFTDKQLRARGVPDDVIKEWRNPVRVWSVEMRRVKVNGAPCQTSQAEGYVALARRRFPRRAA